MRSKKSAKKSKLSASLSKYSGKTLARLVALKDITAEGWHQAFPYERDILELNAADLELIYD